MSRCTFVEKNLEDIVGNYEVEIDGHYFPKIKSQSAKAIFPVSNLGHFKSCFIIFYDKDKNPIDGVLETNQLSVRKMFDTFTDTTNFCYR